MTIRVTCPACSRTYQLKDEFAGRSFKCKDCQEPLQVPTGEQDEFDDDFVEAPPRRRSTKKRSKNAKSPSPSPLIYVAGALGGVALLGGLIWLGMSGDKPAPMNAPVAGPTAAPGLAADSPASPAAELPVQGGPDQPFPVADYRMPEFPELGSPKSIPGSAVQLFDVSISNPQLASQPAFNMQLRVYLPPGEHAAGSLPLVIVAPAGTPLFIGNQLDDGDYHDETLPYAEAGACVVAYSLDGGVPDLDEAHDILVSIGYRKFQRACAGLVNARCAIEFALAKIPAIDSKRIISSGHSSAGTLSVLVAEHEPRLRACIAHCPCTDVVTRCDEIVREIGGHPGFLGIADFFRKSSPLTHANRIQCPVFLFHAFDDENIPYSESQAFQQLLVGAGKTCVLSEPHARGGHYQPMIDEGIPRAITWLRQQSLLP